MIGGGVEIFRRAAIALDRAHGGVARIHRRAAQLQQIFEQMRHQLARRRFHLQAQIGRLAVGAADAKLFHLEAAVMLHHLVEDVLHHVGVDQVAFGFDDFL